ncbi:MAG TPA: type II toxin-antitoxin system HicA family toxin [Thermoplasmatales archaeon]|nr:type II toxin-antitoxin system HicA family toxin [Thermoplasmata archaeon]HHF56131.1 type II toxin-antitoxin system HicA family toxin [Thermoplasmatales archaeon]
MKLPVVSGMDVIKALHKAGFIVIRQKGSHVILKKISGEKIIKLTVPLHKTIKKGTLRKILDIAEISVEEFLKLLRK